MFFSANAMTIMCSVELRAVLQNAEGYSIAQMVDSSHNYIRLSTISRISFRFAQPCRASRMQHQHPAAKPGYDDLNNTCAGSCGCRSTAKAHRSSHCPAAPDLPRLSRKTETCLPGRYQCPGSSPAKGRRVQHGGFPAFFSRCQNSFLEFDRRHVRARNCAPCCSRRL